MHLAGHTPDGPHPRGGSVDPSAAISPSVTEIEALKVQLLEARKQATLGRTPWNDNARIQQRTDDYSQLRTARLEASRQRNS